MLKTLIVASIISIIASTITSNDEDRLLKVLFKYYYPSK